MAIKYDVLQIHIIWNVEVIYNSQLHHEKKKTSFQNIPTCEV